MEEMRPNQRASRHYGGLYSYGFRCCSDDEVRRLHRLARRRRGGAAKHLEVAHERAEGSVVVEQLERGLHGEGVGKGVCRRIRGGRVRGCRVRGGRVRGGTVSKL